MAKLDIRAVIMAGGSGTRFWPMSRKRVPKQFLPIISARTMIEETALRLLPLIPYRRIYTIAGESHSRNIRRLLPKIPRANVLVEPRARNTAPALILATARIYLENPRAVVLVLPADHLIHDRGVFLKKLEAAAVAASDEEALVTFGIPAESPATGYGYIQCRKTRARRIHDERFYAVQAFKEKPSYEQAAAFLKEGGYFWNSGMFIWRAEVFARSLERFAPDFAPFWIKALDALGKRSRAGLSAVFEEIPSLSIDYALMEKARGVLVCEGDFGWSDVGAWSSLPDIWGRDKNGNSFRGECVAVDSRGALCFSPGKLTALIGVSDLIVVNTRDALLVCRADQDQKVKEVLELLKKQGKTKYL